MTHTLKTQTHHGITIEDRFDWLRADNWQEVLQNPGALPEDIRAHLEAENNATADYLAPTEALQKELYQELKGRLKDDDAGVPFQHGDYQYSWRFEKGADYRTWYRKDTNGQEEILLDEVELAQAHEYFQLGDYVMSPDHKYLAYTADTQGSEFYSLYVKDLDAGTTVCLAENIASDVVWGADSAVLLFVKLTDNHKPEGVYRIRRDSAEAIKVFEESDKSLFVSVSKTEDGAYICINSHDHSLSEVSVLSALNVDALPRVIMPRVSDVQYSITHWQGRFYCLTNHQAEDFQVLTAPALKILAGEPVWQTLVQHKAGHLIEGMTVQNGYLLLEYCSDAQLDIKILNLETGVLRALDFGDMPHAAAVITQQDVHHPRLRLSYSTPIQPSQIWEAELDGEGRELLKETEIPSGFNPEDYVAVRRNITAADGAEVPLTLWHHKDTDPKIAPVLQYGYGAYGMSMFAAFRHSAFSLVDRGFVYAIAHVRGGKECGYKWYKDGKLQNKKNTFHDFLDVTQALQQEYAQAQGESAKRYICAHGGSAGGMLMGAVANMVDYPDISAIVAQVPFVDVLSTILDDSLPLTPPEWREWGNPITHKSDFEYIQSYSPYDNVTKKAYPAIYALGGLSDPRVTYWEPAKWIAKLREYKTNADAPLLLDIDMTSGHGGASGRYAYLEEIAKVQAFVLQQYEDFKDKFNQKQGE